ncbi:MAG: DUF2807 domain-containing protein [Bacteroidota bacterium]
MTEIRYPGVFTNVKVFDKINLNIVSGPAHKVEVSAYRHTIKNISTEVRDGILYVNNNNTCNFVRGYKKTVTVTVTVPDLARVENWGVGVTRFEQGFKADRMRIIAESSGDIYLDGSFKNLSTYSNGNGDIHLSGNCDSLNIFMNGTNFLYGDKLSISTYVRAESLSIGDCFLNAASAQQLDYAIYRSGNIYYRGNPVKITKVVTTAGTGSLIKEE